MSALLSIVTTFLLSMIYVQYYAFQVGCFRDCGQHWMILGLASFLQNAGLAMAVRSRFSDHGQELGLAHVIRAGAGHQSASRAQHLHDPKIEFLVAAEGGFHVALALGEGRWVEDDGVVLSAC